jgi:predicted DNA binding CopG/RHH family protein
MPDLTSDIQQAREKDRKFLLPAQDVLSIRLTTPQARCIKTRALEQGTNTTEVIRALLRAGAAHYGFSLDRVI